MKKTEKNVLSLVEDDLLGDADPDKGRDGMPAHSVLRLALVKQQFGWSYERLYGQVQDSICVRKFCGYQFAPVPKPSTLQENIKKIRPETFQALNAEIVKYANKEGIEDGSSIRIDSTAVETNIHHPTDSSLLHDGVRLLCRMMKTAQKVFPHVSFGFHDRTRVTKRLVFNIANAKSNETQFPLYKELLKYAEEVIQYGLGASIIRSDRTGRRKTINCRRRRA